MYLQENNNVSDYDNGGNSTYYNYYDYTDDYKEPLFVTVLTWFETAFIQPVGLLGNLLVIVILSKKKYRSSSTAVLFTVLAVSDIIVLIGNVFINYPATIEGSRAGCKITVFLAVSSAHLSSCSLALVAIERVVMVLIPHRAKFIFTAGNARIMICALSVLILGVNSTILYGFDQVFEICAPTDALQNYFDNIFPWIDFCLAFALPFTIILTCSIIIIVKVRSKSISKGSATGKFPSFTKVLLSANVCFLVTMSPVVLYTVVDPEVLFIGFDTFPFRLCVTMALMNSAANFFLYFLNAPVFREDVRQLLCHKASNTR